MKNSLKTWRAIVKFAENEHKTTTMLGRDRSERDGHKRMAAWSHGRPSSSQSERTLNVHFTFGSGCTVGSFLWWHCNLFIFSLDTSARHPRRDDGGRVHAVSTFSGQKGKTGWLHAWPTHSSDARSRGSGRGCSRSGESARDASRAILPSSPRPRAINLRSVCDSTGPPKLYRRTKVAMTKWWGHWLVREPMAALHFSVLLCTPLSAPCGRRDARMKRCCERWQALGLHWCQCHHEMGGRFALNCTRKRTSKSGSVSKGVMEMDRSETEWLNPLYSLRINDPEQGIPQHGRG